MPPPMLACPGPSLVCCSHLFTLATHPMTYTAGDSLVYAPVLAFLCAQAALTMLHWTLLEPVSCRPSVFEVLSAHLAHSMAGVRKAYQRRTQQQGEGAGSSKEAAAEARRRVSRPWVVSVLAAAAAVLRVSLYYDVSFYLLCRATSYCDPVGSSTAPFAGVRQAGESGGLVPQAAAYLQQYFPALLAGLSMGLELNLVYCWVVLLLSVAAFASPQLRLFCAQLPASAFDRPCATSSLRELWGRRWQQFLRFHYEGLGAKAADGLLGMLPASWPVPAALHGALVGAAAFGISALSHEYVTWAAYGTLTGCYLAFFGIQWVAVLLESAVAGQQHRLLTRCWAWAVCVLTAPLFFEPLRVSGFYSDHAFIALVSWAFTPGRRRI